MRTRNGRSVRDWAGLGVTGLAVGLMGASLGGCTSQESYDDLYETNKSLTSRNEQLQRENAALQNRTTTLQNELGQRDGAMQQLRNQNESLAGELSGTMGDLASFNERFRNLSLSPLDAETDQALASLAQRHAGVMSYDASRGMLRFESDLTFASGSAEVKADAKRALQSLASILGSSTGTSYELRIVGHTDAQRISSSTARRHPTNMHLSVHRAISVRSELVRLGVPGDRIMAGGWGEHRPVVANTGNGNTPANRRVEIYLTASGASTLSAGQTDGAGGGAVMEERQPVPAGYDVTK